MDCYIVRIYRRILSEDGGADEVVGLVEPVQKGEDKMAFSSYADLVNLLQQNCESGVLATDGAVMELLDENTNIGKPE